MADTGSPDVLVERLHLLRSRSGLSTQQMAERCGIPKSSMESYIRLKNPKRPGIDALLAISDGMNVSLDWLAGRVDDRNVRQLYPRDYAMGCFQTVLGLLKWIREEHERDPQGLVTQNQIAGREDAEIAARSMAEFIEAMHSYLTDPTHWLSLIHI